MVWTRYILLAFCFFMAESCDRDELCESHQVCCGDRCKSWPKCFLNTDKECFYNSHCVKGAICVSHVCKPEHSPPRTCQAHEDCVLQKHSKTYDLLLNTTRCCRGKCYKTKSCLTLGIINTTIRTPQTRAKSSCTADYNCQHGFECIGARCVIKHDPVDVSRRTNRAKDRTLSRAGFLSAAILTSTVFLIVMCFCFLKETKYVRRHMERAQARESLTHSTSCSTQPVYQEEQRNSTTRTSWMLFPGLHGYSHTERREHERQEDCSNSAPPSYRSVCFEHELPPSYDEAVNRTIRTTHVC